MNDERNQRIRREYEEGRKKKEESVALDRRVSIEVMGYELEEWTDDDGDAHVSEGVPGVGAWGFLSLLPAYSTDLLAAWRVVEHLRTERRLECHLTAHPDGYSVLKPELDPDGKMVYIVQFVNRLGNVGWPKRWPVGHGPTMAEAICRAALIAVQEGTWVEHDE